MLTAGDHWAESVSSRLLRVNDRACYLPAEWPRVSPLALASKDSQVDLDVKHLSLVGSQALKKRILGFNWTVDLRILF